MAGLGPLVLHPLVALRDGLLGPSEELVPARRDLGGICRRRDEVGDIFRAVTELREQQEHVCRAPGLSGQEPGHPPVEIPRGVRPATAPARAGPQVLLAEDNPVDQKVAARMLERLGCRVDVVSDGRATLAALEQKRYDLVFLDCQIPTWTATRRAAPSGRARGIRTASPGSP